MCCGLVLVASLLLAGSLRDEVACAGDRKGSAQERPRTQCGPSRGSERRREMGRTSRGPRVPASRQDPSREALPCNRGLFPPGAPEREGRPRGQAGRPLWAGVLAQAGFSETSIAADDKPIYYRGAGSHGAGAGEGPSPRPDSP